jgi:hypothetical protein
MRQWFVSRWVSNHIEDMVMVRLLTLLACTALLTGCGTGLYTLVQPKPVAVAQGTMTVQPSIAWNKFPKVTQGIPYEENWTQNGPVLDVLTFIGGLPDGQAIVKQGAKDDRKVPVFRSNMTPQDLVSMLESYYRIKAGATLFETSKVAPAKFLGQQGIEFGFNYVRADEVKRRGRAFLAVADGKLYLMSLDAAALHYFEASSMEFAAMAASAVRS